MNRQERSGFVAARRGRFLKAITSHRGYHHRSSIACYIRRSCLRRPAQRSLNIWRRKLPASMGTTEHKYADFRAESASPNSRPTGLIKRERKIGTRASVTTTAGSGLTLMIASTGGFPWELLAILAGTALAYGFLVWCYRRQRRRELATMTRKTRRAF
jgi:hypothetical protein